jgi:pimeloyl-ACP methyl ester carboxylesterase
MLAILQPWKKTSDMICLIAVKNMSSIKLAEQLTDPWERTDTDRARLTYCLVHGSWHGAGCWENVQIHLESAGQRTIAPDLPIDTDATFDELSEIVSEDIWDEKNTVLVVTSRAGNLGPRVAANLSLKQVIYLCAGFEIKNQPNHTGPLQKVFQRTPPKKYSESFEEGMSFIDKNQTMTIYDPDIAREVFYHDCPPDVQEEAIAQLRPTYRVAGQPPIKVWPDVPTTFIMAEGDKVYNPKYSRYAAARLLGVKAVVMSGGHCPYYQRPEELAANLLAFTNTSPPEEDGI